MNRTVDQTPDVLLLALNKAKTVSWRLGIAWTLISDTGKILVCNGSIFNQHTRTLINDIQSMSTSKKLYISYCPDKCDLGWIELTQVLRVSSLIEIHICGDESDEKAIAHLSREVAIPIHRWPLVDVHSAHMAGIAWVRRSCRPWIHVFCSNSLGGGTYPLSLMSEELGVAPYVMLKGLESSLLYVQNDCVGGFFEYSGMSEPTVFKSSTALLKSLGSLSASTASVVTVVCSPYCLADTIKRSLVNEVSYFLTLRSSKSDPSTLTSIVEFPKDDQWVINSSDVRGDFMQVVLQKG